MRPPCKSRLEVEGKRGRLLSLLAAPVQSGAVTLGVVVVGHKQAGAFTLQHAETLTSMASRAWGWSSNWPDGQLTAEKVEELGVEEGDRPLPGRMHARHGISARRGEGRLASTNRRAAEMIGQCEDDWQGKPFARLICTWDRGAWRRLADEVAEGETLRLAAHMLDRDNSEVAVKLSGRLRGIADHRKERTPGNRYAGSFVRTSRARVKDFVVR